MARTKSKNAKEFKHKGTTTGRSSSKKENKSNTPKQERPNGCVACPHFTVEKDTSMIRRGTGGLCSAKEDPISIAQLVVENKTISNNCPLYDVTAKAELSCKACGLFTLEKDIAMIRLGTGGYCGFDDKNMVVSTYVSSNDIVPDNCPKSKGG